MFWQLYYSDKINEDDDVIPFPFNVSCYLFRIKIVNKAWNQKLFS